MQRGSWDFLNNCLPSPASIVALHEAVQRCVLTLDPCAWKRLHYTLRGSSTEFCNNIVAPFVCTVFLIDVLILIPFFSSSFIKSFR